MSQSHELHTSNRAVPSHGGHIWELNGGVPSRSAGSPNKNAGVNVSCPPPLSPSIRPLCAALATPTPWQKTRHSDSARWAAHTKARARTATAMLRTARESGWPTTPGRSWQLFPLSLASLQHEHAQTHWHRCPPYLTHTGPGMMHGQSIDRQGLGLVCWCYCVSMAGLLPTEP